jgi:DNA-binding winged helix-turn-helix (wHTH) protein/TolB-like protein
MLFCAYYEHMPTVYRFGRFRYDAAQRVLYGDGEVAQVLPKALDVLHALIERRDRIVDKAELMKLVWPDTVVEEIGLARNISILRKALGEPEAGTFIETVPKRGYRFVAEVTVEGEEAPAPRKSYGPWPALAIGAGLLAVLVFWQFYVPSRYLPGGLWAPSIAVIPFETLSPELRADALNELLTAELSKMPGVRVLSPSTVRRYRGFGVSPALMARIIGVAATLEGAIAKGGGGLVITARLADVHTGKLIWADTFEAASIDLALARRIAAGAGAKLKP